MLCWKAFFTWTHFKQEFVASKFNPVELRSHRSSNSSAQNQKTNSSKGLQARTTGQPEDLRFTQAKEEFKIEAVASSTEPEQVRCLLRT